MIDEGVLENPKVDAAFGCHIWPSIKAGHVAIKDGAMMSHPTTFEIIFQEKVDMLHNLKKQLIQLWWLVKL